MTRQGKIVARIKELAETGERLDRDGTIAAVRAVVSDASEAEVVAGIKRFLELNWAEAEEANAAYARLKRQAEEAVAIQSDLPGDLTLMEACRIKAARGDPSAIRMLAWFES